MIASGLRVSAGRPGHSPSRVAAGGPLPETQARSYPSLSPAAAAARAGPAAGPTGPANLNLIDCGQPDSVRAVPPGGHPSLSRFRVIRVGYPSRFQGAFTEVKIIITLADHPPRCEPLPAPAASTSSGKHRSGACSGPGPLGRLQVSLVSLPGSKSFRNLNSFGAPGRALSDDSDLLG